MKKKGVRSLFWVLPGIFAAVVGCGEKNAYKPPPAPKVIVSQPVKQSVTDYLNLTGNTQAINTVQLRARVAGYLEKVLFNDGDRVKKGQLLFVIQQDTYEARLQQAKANVLAQQAAFDHAKIEYARYSELVKQKAASQTDVDQWQYQRDAAAAGVLAAQAARDLAALDLEYTQVTATFDGRVDRRLVDPGNLVGAGENTVLTTINQIDPIYVYFTLNENDLIRAIGETQIAPERAGKANMPVFFGLATEKGYDHRGHLDFTAISVTPTTGTLLLRGIFPNPKGMILPGLFARVRVPIALQKSALLVPKVALSFDQQGAYVLIVNDKNVVERRGVTLGPETNSDQVIMEGLSGTEWVVVDGMLRGHSRPGGRPGKERKGQIMISRFFIEHPIFANVIAIITIIIGLVCFFNLPVAQYPEIVPPTIQVFTRYPGASAEVVAATVGIPIEQAVNGVENSLYMSSKSASDGTYTLTITFDVGTNLNTSVALVQNLVNSALSQLPSSVLPQGVTVRKVSTDILLVISLFSEDERFDETFLSNYAVINLQNPLARLPGVGQVSVRGAGPYGMRVWLDPNKLYKYSLTTLDVMAAIQGQNVQVVAGQLGGPPVPNDQVFQFTVNALGRLADVRQFEDIIIKSTRTEAAQLVRVRDVARVELSQQSFSNFSRVRGHKSTQIPIFTLPGANALTVADEVRQAMIEMSKDFPPGLTYGIYYDTTRFVRYAINDVYITLFEAGVLVLVVVMVFLQNWRAILVPATTVPVTIIGAFAAMALLGFTVNLMTLFALILAIGIVVDDAIVIVENSSYYIERGLPPKEATIKAMGEMTGPVMGITLVLTAVFLPASFLPGITGQLFRQFALVIAATAIISAVNALTLKPAQCALWLRPRSTKPLNLFYRGFNRVYGVLERIYVSLVSWMVHHPLLMVPTFIAIIVVSGWGFAHQPTGFLPVEDQGYAIIVGRLPDGASQPRLEAVTVKVSNILKKTRGIRAWVTFGGLSILDAANMSNIFTTFIVYDDWSQRGSKLTQNNIIAHLHREFAGIKEAQVFALIPPSIRGLGQAGGFQMMLEDRRGIGLTELQKVAMEVIRAASTQSGLVDLTTTFSARSPQLYLDIDRTKTESLNVPINNVFDTLQAYLGSSFVNLFNKFNQVFQVYVQADAPYRLRPEDIKNLYVRNRQGQMVPLGTLLETRRILGAELVTRYNLYPAVALFGSAAPGFSTGQSLTLMENVAENTLPPGMDYDWTATAYQEKQVGPQAYFIYALSITLVFLVLAALYESWTNPAAVIVTVPLALVGILLGLMIRGYDNNLYTQVGLVLMIALASKNAILIVEFARELHADGKSITEAAVEATRRRFRPIMMTSFAFILGVTPLLVASEAGAASQRAIGTVVFGGMLSSTLLAIPFVPVFYVVMQTLSEKYKRTKR